MLLFLHVEHMGPEGEGGAAQDAEPGEQKEAAG
jgi:hypothetical protein